jgi:hypothetical protein
MRIRFLAPRFRAPLLLAASVFAAAAFGERHWTVQTACAGDCWTPSCCGYTEYSAGESPNDLKVHVVGDRFDTIEVTFHNEGVDLDQFKRVTFPETLNLHCAGNIVLAPRNPSGTFAVRYGAHLDKVRVYGWRKQTITLIDHDLPVDPNYPVRIQWMTTQIVKVHHGPNQSKELIFQFNSNTDPPSAWQPLYP